MSVSRPRTIFRAFVTLLVAPSFGLGTLASVGLGSLVTASPAQAQTIRPTFWGMHHNEWTAAPTVPVGSANFTTTGTLWPNIETQSGHFEWARLDQQVAAAERLHAQPEILLGQTPRFHSTKPGSVDYVDYMPQINAWKTYVTKVAQRYGTRLDYQIWPEPNIVQNWKGTPAQMAQLTVVAAKAIHQYAGKRATVVSPAVALRLPEQRAWAVNYFKQSVGGTRVHRYVDAIAVDPFPASTGTPEDSFHLMQTVRNQLARIGVRKPFWNNEINYGVTGGHAATHVTYSIAKQQSYVIRTYVLSAAAQMARTYWLAWFPNAELAINMSDSNGHGLPPARSYAVVRSWLNNTQFAGCTQKNGLWACTTRMGSNEVRRIYWKTSGTAAIKTPQSVTRVENQNGSVSTRHGSYAIRVDYRPIMVASRK
jgi:hypothetical protein